MKPGTPTENAEALEEVIRQALAGHETAPQEREEAVAECLHNAQRALSKWFPGRFLAPVEAPVEISDEETTAIIHRVRAVLHPPPPPSQSRRAEKRATKHRRNLKKGRK